MAKYMGGPKYVTGVTIFVVQKTFSNNFDNWTDHRHICQTDWTVLLMIVMLDYLYYCLYLPNSVDDSE